MSDEKNDAVRADTDDLDAFESLFNSKTTKVNEPKAPDGDVDEEVEDVVEEVEDTEDEESVEDEDNYGDDDSPAPEEEESEEDDDDEDDSDEEDDSKNRKKKLTARERVEQAVARQREAERQRDELIARIERLEQSNKKEEEEPAPKQPLTKKSLEEDAPRSDAVDEEGDLIYPLGDLDPAYIRDLTKWSAKQANEELKAEEAAKERQRQQEEANRQLVENWQQKLEKAERDIPEVRKKGQKLEDSFRNIDPEYGQALAATIMSLDYGPHVIDYLADNLQEAQDIVKSDPLMAVLKLGSLNERLSTIYGKNDQNSPKKKVSSAPRPAPTNRGNNRTKKIRADTDNLDDFEKLFNKR